MANANMLARTHRAEITWQVVDVSVMLALACTLFAVIAGDASLGLIAFVVSVVCAAFYLFVEREFEASIAKLQHARVKQHPLQVRRELRRDLVYTGLFIGSASLASFYLTFSRLGVSAQYAPHGSSVYGQAASVFMLTLVICVIAHLVRRRLFLTSRLHTSQIQKQRVRLAHFFAVAFTLLLANFTYLASPYPLHATTQSDWLVSLIAAGMFITLSEFQQWDRKHHRKALHELHQKLQATPENI